MNPDLMKIGVWNVRGLYGKEKLLQEESKKANADIVVIPETKQKF
jgi:exonuclease III